jgi:major membrane immunogen (membrane-anchored lipoprotein)
MKKIIYSIFCLTCFFILAGCADPSIITLKDGTVIETTDEPDFDHKTGFYEFETVDGREAKINKDEVLEIKER